MRTRAAVPKVLEKNIEQAITDLLALDGWRPLKTDPVSDRARGKGFGELGMADHLYIRYDIEPDAFLDEGATPDAYHSGAAVMWIEHKRPKGVAAQHQKAWHSYERSRGALTLIAGQDFPASVDGFWEWYRNSGLMRKDIRL